VNENGSLIVLLHPRHDQKAAKNLISRRAVRPRWTWRGILMLELTARHVCPGAIRKCEPSLVFEPRPKFVSIFCRVVFLCPYF